MAPYQTSQRVNFVSAQNFGEPTLRQWEEIVPAVEVQGVSKDYRPVCVCL